MIKIATNNEIYLDGKATGYGVVQKQNGTQVYTMDAAADPVPMPEHTYALADPKSRDQFEADFRAAVGL